VSAVLRLGVGVKVGGECQGSIGCGVGVYVGVWVREVLDGWVGVRLCGVRVGRGFECVCVCRGGCLHLTKAILRVFLGSSRQQNHTTCRVTIQ
jgi:hypothetical protein